MNDFSKFPTHHSSVGFFAISVEAIALPINFLGVDQRPNFQVIFSHLSDSLLEITINKSDRETASVNEFTKQTFSVVALTCLVSFSCLCLTVLQKIESILIGIALET